MKRRPLNLLTALSLLLLVAACGLWVRSRGDYTQFDWGEGHATGFGWVLYDHSLSVQGGTVYYVRSYPPLVALPPGGASPERYESLGFLWVRGPDVLVPDSVVGVHQLTVGVPLWAVVLAAAALPAGRLAWRLRRRAKGCCRSCGYDLTGNESGVCPECGAAATTTV